MIYYHCTSSTRWGSAILLKPRIPISAPGCEPPVKRICAAPTISQCIIACEGLSELRAVYFTEEKPDEVCPDVPDWDLTEEVWFTRPVMFYLLGRAPYLDAPGIDLDAILIHSSDRSARERDYLRENIDRWVQKELLPSLETC